MYSSYLPYFVNYPDDWAKMGLRNRPMAIKYSGIDSWTNHPFYICYHFNISGNLNEIENSALGRDVFTYDNDNKIIGISRMRNILSDDKKNQFEYADSLLIRRTTSPSPSTVHSFSYYPSGVLKEITPERAFTTISISRSASSNLTKKESSSGQSQLALSTPFLEGPGGYNADTRNVCTFKYDKKVYVLRKEKS